MKPGKRPTKETKEIILKRMMPPINELISTLSEEFGISETTLYKWRKDSRINGDVTPGDGQESKKWSSEDKFLVAMETYAMNEAELAEYCRRKWLYKEQVNEWRSVCLSANGRELHQTKQLNNELREEKGVCVAMEPNHATSISGHYTHAKKEDSLCQKVFLFAKKK